MKKVFCAILSLSLILLPCSVFADTASGSAISLDDRLKLAELSGVATPSSNMALAATAAAQDVYITGFTYPSSGTPYYFYTGSTVNSNFIGNSTMLGGLATGITQSIANSAQGLASKIPDHSTVLNTIKNSLSSISGYVDGVETAISTANSRLLTIANKSIASPSDVSTAASNIVSAIENNSFTIPQGLIDDVDSIESKTPSQDYFWNKYLTNISGQIPSLSQGGVFKQQAFDFGSNSLLGGIEALLYYGLSGTTNGVSLLVRDVRDNNAALDDYLYDSALTATLIPRTTVWQNMRDFWTNTSYHLSRLAFVLANDEDIEARQAAQSNTASVVDNFIKPSGSASASVSDFGSVADIASAGSDSLSSGVSPSVLLNQLGGDGDGWGWFSRQIQDELSAPSGRSSLRSYSKSNSSDTPYLDAYYRDLEEKIGFKLW